jgi:hypothetical protein
VVLRTCTIALLLAAVNLPGNQTNPPVAKTGAPGEGTCAQCHTGTVDNPGSVLLVFEKFTYAPGVREAVTVQISSARPILTGWQLTARVASNPLLQAGHFESSPEVTVANSNGIEYASGSAATVTFNWTPPATNVGDIIFYVAAVTGESNGHPDGNVYTAKFVLRAPSTRDLPAGFQHTSFAVSGAAITNPGAISNNGSVVGSFRAGSQTSGFWRQANGDIVTFDAPGAVTQPRGVNNAGRIVGSVANADGSNSRGFIRDPATGLITLFTVPGAISTALTGINDAGVITGNFTDDAGAAHVLTMTNPPAFDFFDAGPSASATGISSNGTISGSTVTGRTPAFGGAIAGGFLRTTDAAISVTIPCSPGTRGGGVTFLYANAFNDIAGSCFSNSAGFPFTSRFIMAPNGRILSDSTGFPGTPGFAGINDSGQITGTQDQRGLIMTPCTVSPASTALSAAAAGGTIAIGLTSANPDCRPVSTSNSSWISIREVVSGTQTLFLSQNLDGSARTGTARIGNADVTITQAGAPCDATLTGSTATFPGSGGTGTMTITVPSGCTWTAVSNASWITLSANPSGTSSGTIPLTVAPNLSQSVRTGTISVGSQAYSIIQTVTPCAFTLTPPAFQFPAQGGTGTINVATGSTCSWSGSSAANWVIVPQTFAPTIGNGTLTFTVVANSGADARFTTVTVGTSTVSITQAGTNNTTGLRFMSVMPCRIADTRGDAGLTGAFGLPRMNGGTTRDFPVPSSRCGVLPIARAYSLNITAVPTGPLGYLTAWPTGQPRPQASTLNSFNGRVIANAAVVPAGANGSISVFVTDATDVIIDINGIFVSGDVDVGLSYYPVTPCRVADTRPGGGKTGEYGPPFIGIQTTRTMSILNSGCGIPSSAQAYALNVTAIPPGYLGFVTVWPTGNPRPNASTLNSWDGQVVANMAVVPGGVNHSISVYASNDTDFVIDINGYFASRGSPGALTYNAITPCRAFDTRSGQGKSGALGPPILDGQTSRSFPIPSSGCVPFDARAYSLNVTAVPPGYLGFLTAWPTGASQPFVSTLNSWNGQVVANAAILPAGPSGTISVYVSNPSHVVLDVNGYFLP